MLGINEIMLFTIYVDFNEFYPLILLNRAIEIKKIKTIFQINEEVLLAVMYFVFYDYGLLYK